MPQDQFDYSKVSDDTLIELRDNNHDYSKISDKAMQELQRARTTGGKVEDAFEVPKTPTLDTIKDIAGRWGVPEETLRSRAAGIGMPAEDVSPLEKGLSYAVGTANAALMGLPSWAAKKFEDEHTEKAIDELKDRLEKQKSGIQSGIETVASLAVPIPGSSLIRGIGAGVKGAGGAALGVGKAAAEGAVAGGLSGLAQSKTGRELEGVADTAGMSALYGGGFGAAGQGLKGLASKLSTKGEGIAAQKAIDVLQPSKTERKNIAKKFGEEQFGQELLRKKFNLGEGKPRALVEAGDTVENVLEKASLAREELGPQIGAAVEKHPDVMVDTSKYIDNLRKDAEERFGGVEGLEDIYQKRMNEVSQAEARYGIKDAQGNIVGYKQIPFKEAYEQRVKLDRVLSDKNVFDSNSFEKNMLSMRRNIWDDSIMEALPEAAGAELKAIKRDYSVIKQAEKLAQSGALGKQNRQSLSPSSKAIGIMQAATGAVPGGKLAAIPFALANQMALERGPATSAVIVDKVSRALKNNPLMFGKFGSFLKNASIKGPAQLQATIERLTQTDPEFKAMVEGDLGTP